LAEVEGAQAVLEKARQEYLAIMLVVRLILQEVLKVTPLEGEVVLVEVVLVTTLNMAVVLEGVIE